jgi:hypothetical protein
MVELDTIDKQIADLETQAKNTETLFVKIQGALEALQVLKKTLSETKKEEKEKKTKK